MATYQNKAHDYYLSMNKKCPVLAKHGRNLNLCCLEDKLDPCYHRESIIDTMQKILLRKNKANILLTGVAGCGKTALVEGLAAVITMRKLLNLQTYLVAQREYKRAMGNWEKSGQTEASPIQPKLTESPLSECVIYELSLNSLVSGTKYRGEFEEKVEDILQECKKNPNVIELRNEVHLLVDTDISPYDSGSYASSTTYLTGNAVADACGKLRESIIKIGADKLGCDVEAVAFDGKKVYRLEAKAESGRIGGLKRAENASSRSVPQGCLKHT